MEEKEAPIRVLDEQDIAFLKNYGLGPYSAPVKKAEQDIKDIMKRVNDLCGIKESDTGLAPPSRWDLPSDKQMMVEEQPLQVSPRFYWLFWRMHVAVTPPLLPPLLPLTPRPSSHP